METVSNLINCLTNDEDHRQELWVHYLSGNEVETFSIHLNKINKEYCEDIEFTKAIWQLMTSPPSSELSKVLEHFTNFERRIIFMLMLGFSTEKISNFLGINEVRIRQAISTIRYNTIWKETYGIKEKPIG